MLSPLEAYNVYIFWLLGLGSRKFGTGLIIDTIFLYSVIVVLISICIFLLPIEKASIYADPLQHFVENNYLFVLAILKQQVANRRALINFPILFTLFNYILLCNLLGLLPFGFTLTAHIVQTFSLGFSIFLGIVIFGINSHKQKFLTLFVPEGVNIIFAFFLVFIELVSYIIRPFSLSVRLFANMLAGHTLLAILSSFVLILAASSYWFIALLPLLFVIFVVILECAIALIQSYVFVILVCIYINEVYNL
jgi:F-type H+-transporting ATPase subunit a